MKTKLSFLSLKTRYKIVFWLTLALLLLFAVTPRGYAQTSSETEIFPTETSPVVTTPQFPYKKTFTISAYYSPLLDQQHYYTGTYESEVRLEGEGVHAADGTQVYPGMAAASKDFAFGTKMEIPGFGIVGVHDRGGAIKGDRLDIWVGSGEEGLARALGWGMRTLEVTVYGKDDSLKEAVNFDGIPLANLTRLTVSTPIQEGLSEGDQGPEVAELQYVLKRLGFLGADATGFFDKETVEALIQFQQKTGIITEATDSDAGTFGPRSKAATSEMLMKQNQELFAKLPKSHLKRGDRSEAVKNLQIILRGYGFLSGPAGDVFDSETFEALLRFQLDAGVIERREDHGAGFYGPKTLSALESFLQNQPVFFKTTKSREFFPDALARGDRGSEVVNLQLMLKSLNFLGVSETGYFGKTTEHAVFKFQQALGIVVDEKTPGAGVAGPQTLSKLREIAARRTDQRKEIAQTTENRAIVAARLEDEKALFASVISATGFEQDLSYGMRGSDIEHLQKVLKRLGFFPGRLTTEYFGDITKNSLLAFQKDHGLAGSGVLDEATRKIFNTILTSAS